MTSRDFCYWLQGYLEIAGVKGYEQALSGEQVACVRRHLAMVFRHEIDPSMPDPKLDEIHATNPPAARPPGHGPVMRC